MWTCSGITSSFSTTSRIDCQALALERTSSVLVSSTAATPTRAPSTSSVTAPLPLSRWLSESEPPPSPPPEPPLPLPPKSTEPPVPFMPPSLICTGSVPGISDTLPAPPVERASPEEAPPPDAPKTSARRWASSRALMYFSS